MTGNTATLTWLVIIALSSVIQTALLVTVLVVANRRLRAAEARIHALEREYLVPMLARLEGALDDVQDVAKRVRRAEQNVMEWSGRMASTAEAAVGLVWAKARPVVGLMRGVRAAARAWSNGAGRKRGSLIGPVAVRRDVGRS